MGVRLCNDLLLEIRNSTSKLSFKRKLKIHLQNAARMKTKTFVLYLQALSIDLQIMFPTAKGDVTHLVSLITLGLLNNLPHLSSVDALYFALPCYFSSGLNKIKNEMISHKSFH